VQALRQKKQEEIASRTPDLPTGRYRVLYADPPWKYQEHGASVDPSYGSATRHYPTMTIEELCALPVKDMLEDDAVLFLWVTSPKLNQVWEIIEAWGFEYKTSFVWDKVGHNFGYYNSVRHELLLICGRGSSTPDEKKLYDSVQSIEKSRTHSEKPEEFRAIIDSLYTHGNRIELFARKQVEGWDTWGNQVD
jgi:N6-adenosine-specific RNA methylase IME4